MPVARNPYSGWAALLYNRLANRGGEYDPVDLTSHGLPTEYNPPDATVDSTPPSTNPRDPLFKQNTPTEKGGGVSFGLGYTPGMPVGSVNSRGAIFTGFSGGKPVFAPQSKAGTYGRNRNYSGSGFSSKMNPRGGGWGSAMTSFLGSLALGDYGGGQAPNLGLHFTP